MAICVVKTGFATYRVHVEGSVRSALGMANGDELVRESADEARESADGARGSADEGWATVWIRVRSHRSQPLKIIEIKPYTD